MSDPIREIIDRAFRNWRRNGNDDRECCDAIIEALHAKGYAIVHEDNVNQWTRD